MSFHTTSADDGATISFTIDLTKASQAPYNSQRALWRALKIAGEAFHSAAQQPRCWIDKTKDANEVGEILDDLSEACDMAAHELAELASRTTREEYTDDLYRQFLVLENMVWYADELPRVAATASQFVLEGVELRQKPDRVALKARQAGRAVA
ncbi:MAG: hypothetical protein CML29_05045 [Rhizobiales bacterium]|nr:hypothetical protein [Hyphomicrobiales bacterium]MBA71021.1 hypothetical protein [Hyphomicrobiales bacterium]